MAILRPNKPPLNAPVDDFVWKKWFQDLYEVTKAGVVSPSPLTYTTSGLQAHFVPKNLLINGDFSVWQRGTTFATGAANPYAADRWQVGRGSVAGMTASRQTGPSGFPFCIRLQRDAGNAVTNDIAMAQSIPSVDSSQFAGQTITLSLWARAGANFSAGAAFWIRLFSGTGTDESLFSGVTGRVTLGEKVITPTTNWVRYTYSVSVGSTANQLFCSLAMRSMPAVASGAADYIEIAGVQIEAGPVASPFQFETFQSTLNKCQRYYTKSFPYATAPATAAGNAGVIQYYSKVAAAQPDVVMVYLRQIMRITPTLTFFNPAAANAKWRNLSAGADSGTAAASGAGDSQFGISNPQVAGDGANALMAVHYTADAEL